MNTEKLKKDYLLASKRYKRFAIAVSFLTLTAIVLIVAHIATMPLPTLAILIALILANMGGACLATWLYMKGVNLKSTMEDIRSHNYDAHHSRLYYEKEPLLAVYAMTFFYYGLIFTVIAYLFK